MDAQEQQHALKGRQKLEEVRRKKAAAAAAGSAQNEVEVLLLRINNLEGELQFEKQRSLDFVTQLQMVESERNLLQRQWEESVLQIQSLSDDLNQSRSQSLQEVATLRKSLESSTMERDAAIVSREDMVAQVRLLKRRLQETEDEQYKVTLSDFCSMCTGQCAGP
jgi:predicted  nucleic acid-binding Zn-ribbon protein